MMRDSAVFRHTIQDRGHPERMRSAPRGGTAAEGADIPPQGTAQAQTGTRREKLARLGLIRGAPLVPLSCLVFPFRGAVLLGGGPPVVWLGFAPRD